MVLNDDDADDLLSASDTVIVTANFSEAMNSAPTLSMSGLITNTAMTATGDPSVWTYSINIASLGPPASGNYLVTLAGSDLAGNTYSAAGGVQDGNEQGVDSISFSIDSSTTVSQSMYSLILLKI